MNYVRPKTNKWFNVVHCSGKIIKYHGTYNPVSPQKVASQNGLPDPQLSNSGSAPATSQLIL